MLLLLLLFQLNKLQDILGLTDTDTAYEIAVEVTPLFQSTASAALHQVLEKTMTPENAWEVLDERREELLLQDASSKDLISSMVMQALGGPLEKTNKFAKVNNEAATYDNLLEALEAKEALISVLTKSGWDEFENFDFARAPSSRKTRGINVSSLPAGSRSCLPKVSGGL